MTAAWIKYLIQAAVSIVMISRAWENKEKECKAVWKQPGIDARYGLKMWLLDSERKVYSQGGAFDAFFYSRLCCKTHVNAEWLW